MQPFEQFAIAARMIPLRFHQKLISWTSAGSRKEIDVFPTAYKLNTLGSIRRYFPGFENFSYYHNGPVSYHAGSSVLYSILKTWAAVMPRQCAQQMHVFLRKK